MLFHIFGEENGETIVMIHGLAMSWDMLGEAVGILAKQYRVIAVAVPGMDMDTREEFTSVEEIAGRIEKELLDRGIKTAECLYGLSMGGGIALRMLADGRVHFKHAILDAAITPYELPRPVTRLILVRDVLTTCAYYAYDEDYEEYYCSIDMDEDDYVRLLTDPSPVCRYYRNGDEYAIVRHQM